MITRRWPLLSGRGTLVNTRLFRRLVGESNEVAWARVPGGRVLAPLEDYGGRSAFYAGNIDPKISWVCERVVRAGDTVLDIGANIGVVTVHLASLVGPTGVVHAFEPNPYLSGLLQRIIAETPLPNVTLHPVALGEEEGHLDLCVPQGHTGQGSLVRDPGQAGTNHRVQVRRLSALLDPYKLRAIRLVKIDVEGFETQVFLGARELFTTRPPDAILFELNDVSAPGADHPTLKILGSLGYRFFSIPRSLIRLRLREYRSAAESGHDFLAVHDGPAYSSIVAAVT